MKIKRRNSDPPVEIKNRFEEVKLREEPCKINTAAI
jgi:hypothetical protein